jgi:FkbM family methyltransferase
MNLIERVQLSDPINIADIGVASINETPAYSDLVIGEYGHLFAFDGDSRQIPALQKLYGEHATFLNHFLADGAQHTAYICREDTAITSLFKPHQSALAFFNNFSSFGKVVKQQRIQTARLDVIDEIGDLHFIKLDVQGSELNVLKKRAQKALELRGCTVRGFFYLFVRKPTKL